MEHDRVLQQTCECVIFDAVWLLREIETFKEVRKAQGKSSDHVDEVYPIIEFLVSLGSLFNGF